MNSDKDWEKKIRDRLHDQASEPPPFAWNRIEEEIRPKRKKRWLIWLPLMLVFLAGLPFVFKQILENKPENKQLSQVNTTQQPATENADLKTELKQKTENNRTELKPGKQTNIQTNPDNSEQPIQAGQTFHPGPEFAGQGAKPAVAVKPVITEKPGKKTVSVLVADDDSENQKEETNQNQKSEKTGVNTAKLLAVEENKKTGVFEAESLKSVEKTKSHAGGDIQSKTEKPVKTVDLALNPKSEKSEKSNPETNKLPESAKQKPEKTDSKNELQVTEKEETAMQEPQSEILGNTLTDGHTLADSVLAQLADSAETAVEMPVVENDSTENNDEIKNGKWSFTIFGSPQYTYRRVQVNKTDNIEVLNLEQENIGFKERFGFDAGLHINYSITPKLKLESGLSFMYLNEKLDLLTATGLADSFAVQQSGNQLTITTLEQQKQQNIRNNYYLGGLYLGASYALMQWQQSSLQLTAGAGLSKLLKADQLEKQSASELNQATTLLSGGIRYSRLVAPGVELQIEPNMHYYLKSFLPDNEIVVQKPITFGVKLGLRFMPK